MITIRPRDQRGSAKFGWLDSKHTFSFGQYYDPANMGFRDLRVINEDRVIPGAGFPTHGHRDMEIISYVLEGALEHKDSSGGSGVIRPGDVQRMTAGTGVQHSEYNASKSEPVHFLQIWIEPEREDLTPGYEQRTYPEADKRGKLRLVASRDGRDGSVTVHQDVDVYATVLGVGDKVSYELGSDRHAWVQVARGHVRLNGEVLKEGDGAAIVKVGKIELAGELGDAEVLLFDLA
jgi:quercetin 2,3-dioxygenase